MASRSRHSSSATPKARSARKRNGPKKGRATAESVGAWARYRSNSARHLIGISRDLETRVMSTLEARGYRGLRPSLGPLLSLLWIEGRPLTAIAKQLAISKQACGQLANLAEEAGYLERKADPEDGRSKLIRLTPRGRELVVEAVQVILESDSAYAELVGAPAYRRFTAALSALYRSLRIPTHSDPKLSAAAGSSIGVLPLIAVRIQCELMEASLARGHVGLKMSHGQVLPLIGPQGGRVHEIARIQGVSRQAISATARDLEALGYLRRKPDPEDRRGVLLQLTDQGAGLIRDSVAGVEELEREIGEGIGRKPLEALCNVGAELYRALHLEQEIFTEASEAPSPSAAQRAGSERASQRDSNDIQRLAQRLRRQLGEGDAARLAALLLPDARRTA